MPRIFDNIELALLQGLSASLQNAHRADFCVGYFNLRGWKQINEFVDLWPGGDDNCCRLLVGMHVGPEDELRQVLTLLPTDGLMDLQTAAKLKRKAAQSFREQLLIGAPTDADEWALRILSRQLRERKVVCRLYLRHPLHAKLYLTHRKDADNPITAYLGSSNLTLAGMSKQGELNVDILDHDATAKLQKWFEDRWADRWCIDITDDLAEIIDESWARPSPIPPYHIYIKMAYHLAREARAGLKEFRIPRAFGNTLFDYQVAAVKIAAHHVNKRHGVLLGDVVGLGKTLMATALGAILQEDGLAPETLIICPPNLIEMWEDYRLRYGLNAKVLSLGRVIDELPNERRYRLLIIDESHNLRNRQSARYRAIAEYVDRNDSYCVLLSATPYNKDYVDLSAQLRLFVDDAKNLGIRPDRYIHEIGELPFQARHQCPFHSILAFEHSPYADDWRELMRLYMVRRTRSFIKRNYAHLEKASGRQYLLLANGEKSFFPERTPKTVRFQLSESDKNDPYARLYNDKIVDLVNHLELARYGLGNFVAPQPSEPPSQREAKVLEDLGRAGKRLMGFARTNLFKRLESSGHAFILSVERHILRNYIFIHALRHGLPLPIGTQDPEMLDTRFSDDGESEVGQLHLEDVIHDPEAESETLFDELLHQRRLPMVGKGGDDPLHAKFASSAAEGYRRLEANYRQRFSWVRAELFIPQLTESLEHDARDLLSILRESPKWDSTRDAKVQALAELITETHPDQKALVFTQFADTVHYLVDELRARGVKGCEGVTSAASHPTHIAWRFSPVSNGKRDRIRQEDDIRVLISTDVLSEGQNLQDAHIIVNFDLPWAIIRLIQRAGRVDRIGQTASEITCYTFWPMDGVNRIIRLRERVRSRLRENAEVVGADEVFFEEDKDTNPLVDLYHEKAGILDGNEDDSEVDLGSYAYQVYKNALEADPPLERAIEALPDVVYSARSYKAAEKKPEGVLVYLRTTDGSDALAYVDNEGISVTESQYAILRMAECEPNTPVAKKAPNHHHLVRAGVDRILEEEKQLSGQLGRPSGARYKTALRLKGYLERMQNDLLIPAEHRQSLESAVEEIYKYPLLQSAADSINRQLRAGISDENLADLVLTLRLDERLCFITDEEAVHEPRIICSLGLVGGSKP